MADASAGGKFFQFFRDTILHAMPHRSSQRGGAAAPRQPSRKATPLRRCSASIHACHRAQSLEYWFHQHRQSALCCSAKGGGGQLDFSPDEAVASPSSEVGVRCEVRLLRTRPRICSSRRDVSARRPPGRGAQQGGTRAGPTRACSPEKHFR